MSLPGGLRDAVPPEQKDRNETWKMSLAAVFLIRGAIGYVGRTLKNGARIILRKPTFGADNAVHRMLLSHLLGRGKIAGITHRGALGEGAGAQALTIIFARSIAQAMGIAYVHTPFNDIAHAEGPAEDWARLWENTFNLGDGARNADEVGGTIIDMNQIYAADGYDAVFVRHLARAIALSRDDLRQRYRPPRPARPAGPLRVAVHIRRGDVSPERNIYMWTDLAVIARTLGQVRQHLAALGLDYRITIVSQGRREEFAAFEDGGVDFMLDEDAVDSFDELVQADILIIAKSTYSHLAAILSRGITLYAPKFVPPLPDWLALEPGGGFDDAAFGARLERHLQTRSIAAEPTIHPVQG